MFNDVQSNNSNPKTNTDRVGVHSSPQGGLCASAPALSFNDIMHRGYFPLWRKITDWGWYKDSNTKSLFLHLLLTCNHKESDFLGHKIPKGHCVHGVKELSAVLGLSIMQIRTSIKHLKSTNEITTTSTNRFTIYKLNNYDKYTLELNLNNKPRNKQITNKQQTDNKQITTSNNYIIKELNTVSKEAIASVIDLFKNIKGYCNNPEWDKLNYPRHAKAAKALLAIAPDDWKKAIEWQSKQDYEWTLETVIKKYQEFRKVAKTGGFHKP